jgi:hypothetical protein
MFQEILVNSFRGQSFTKTLPANSRTGQKHELRKFEIYTTETVCDHFSETTERNFLTLSSYYKNTIPSATSLRGVYEFQHTSNLTNLTLTTLFSSPGWPFWSDYFSRSYAPLNLENSKYILLKQFVTASSLKLLTGAIWQIWPWRLFLAHLAVSRMSFYHHFASGVRPSVRPSSVRRQLFIQRSSPLELLDQLKPNLVTMDLHFNM